MTRPIPIAPMMANLVRTWLAAVDGTVFEKLDCCLYCGGPVRPHDYRAKRFATLTDGTVLTDVHVRVKRFRCARCGRLCYADSPFYPGTRHGAPIVELAAVLSERMPPGRAVQALASFGIVLDRATVRAYARLPLPPIMTMDLFGIPIPVSTIQRSVSASLLSLAASGTSLRAAPAKEGDERQKEDDKEERNAEQKEDRAQPE